MARIRTVKPEFFRHEGLQDLEIANPGKYPMMVFEGLWGHCDSKGRFEWRPRLLKLDILPFLPFDMAETLSILEAAGMVRRYSVDGRDYGEVPTFEKHQRLSGKESSEGEKLPAPPAETRGSVGEAPGKQWGNTRIPGREGKGREEEGNGVPGSLPENFPEFPIPAGKPTGPVEILDPEAKPETETALQAACRITWHAYSESYQARYGTAPVRNAKVNASVKGLLKRIGTDESPLLAAWFIGHPDAFYTRKMHDIGLLLADCEKLRTEWATGRQMTGVTARQQEQTAGNFAAAEEAIRNIRARSQA